MDKGNYAIHGLLAQICAAQNRCVEALMHFDYVEMLADNRDLLMLQHQAYAACDDEVIRDRVRAYYARLVTRVEQLSGADPERIDEFFRYGMWLNVAAAMGVEDLSAGCEWVRAEGQK